jgi:hypothetical protein
MGEVKKIDVTGLASTCRSWLPVFQAADHLRNIGIAGLLDVANACSEFVSFAEINAESAYTISGTHRIVSLAVRAGLIEKNPEGGRGPLYRGTERLRGVLAATVKTDALYFISHFEDIFAALNKGPFGQAGLCFATDTLQATMSLQMKRIIAAGWVDREQTGKEVCYSLSDYARQIMPMVAAELKGLK